MNDKAAILAVDDSSELLELLVQILTAAGYQVRSADNGESALVAVAAKPPDLILLDIRMMGMGGIETCRLLKTKEETKQIPIILMSAFAEAKEWVTGLQLGAADYITKPFQVQELLARVKTHLALSRANLSLEEQAVVLRQANEQMRSEVVKRGQMEDELRRSLDRTERSRRAMLSALEDRKRSEENLHRQTDVTEAINRILQASLQAKTDTEVARICLSVAEKLTDSKFGWIGEINPSGRLNTIALSDPGWESCRISGADIATIKDMEIRGIFRQILKDGKSFITNEPAAYPNRVELPSGHPKLTAFLGVPMKQDGRIVGMVALGNKPSGYESHDQEAVEALSVAFVEALQRKRAETALRESEQRFRGFIENASDIVYELTKEGTFTYVSPNWLDLIGEPASEALGKSFEPYVHPDDVHLCREFLERVIATGERLTSVDYRLVRRDLSIRWHSSKGSALYDGDGNIVAYMGISRDITERKLAEEEREKLQTQLNQAQKMEFVGRLAGGVAHDFNNMLGVILGHVEIADAQVGPAEPIHADLEEIRKAAEHSADLTRQLLAFARKQTVAPKVLDLNDTVAGVLKMLQRLIGENIDLAWLPGAELWSVKIDPSQIDQILANLCVNARDAIAGVGKVTVKTENVMFNESYCGHHAGFISGEFVLLAVSDDGCGMDKETLSKIFEPFFTTKDIGKGTGLGLPMIYGIVNQNNGFINVDSEPNKGTTFNIYLPRHIAEIERLRNERLATPATHGHEVVLIVEDEPAMLRLTSRILEHHGYTVLVAATPSEAVRLAEKHVGEIHLLMTDVIMPEMNGQDLVNNLLPSYPNLKRMFMSGYPADAIAHHGVLDEGVYFIQKPFSTQDLAAKVREVLDKKTKLT